MSGFGLLYTLLMASGPIVIVGGFMSWPRRYGEFAEILRELSGSEVRVAPLTPLDWLSSLVRGGGQLVFEIATTVDRALLESEAKKVILVGHAVGGVASRVYIGGEKPYGGRRYSGHRRVSHLITLGSPHFVKDRWPFSLLSSVNDLFPGALHKESGLRYVSVAGAAADGAKDPKVRKLYERVIEDGRVPGDGLLPVEAALLPGSEHVILEDFRRDGEAGLPYVANREVVELWWPEELRRDDRMTG
ncbi:MAG: esterase/lipase family protein [Rubrobacteraceae bacterium]